MEIYTIGTGNRSAEEFFGALRETRIARLVDVRLRNTSQLAGFTKQRDLPYFLRELCGVEYAHELALAPTATLLDGYRKKQMTWDDYASGFLSLVAERHVESTFGHDWLQTRSVLLCSEARATKCHRRLVAEYLSRFTPGLKVVHL